LTRPVAAPQNRSVPPLRTSFAVSILVVMVAVTATSSDAIERGLYEFAVHLSEQVDDGFADEASEELARYARLYPEGRYIDDVHLRMARVARSLGDLPEAAARYLQVLIVDAGSPRAPMANDELPELLRHRSLRKEKPRFEQALELYRRDGPLAERRFAYLRALLLIADERAADVLAEEMIGYLETYPTAAALAELTLDWAALERRRGEHRRAVAACERIGYLWPSSRLVPRARLLAAEILASELDDTVGALRRYRLIVTDHRESTEAATAWLRLGHLEREEFDRPKAAISHYDEVLSRYPQHPDAFDALMAKSETLADDLRDPRRAVDVLVQGADRYAKHTRAPEALYAAGRLEERKLKDRSAAAALYARLARSYPRYERAPELMFRSAELLEKDGRIADAIARYREVADRFPGHDRASKAVKRADKLAGS